MQAAEQTPVTASPDAAGAGLDPVAPAPSYDAQDGATQPCLRCAAQGRSVASVATLRLALGERSGTADLCDEHLRELRELIDPLIDAAAGRRRRRPNATSVPRLRGDEDREVVRAWARSRGLPVSSSGGISAAVLARYRSESDVISLLPPAVAPAPRSGVA